MAHYQHIKQLIEILSQTSMWRVDDDPRWAGDRDYHHLIHVMGARLTVHQEYNRGSAGRVWIESNWQADSDQAEGEAACGNIKPYSKQQFITPDRVYLETDRSPEQVAAAINRKFAKYPDEWCMALGAYIQCAYVYRTVNETARRWVMANEEIGGTIGNQPNQFHTDFCISGKLYFKNSQPPEVMADVSFGYLTLPELNELIEFRKHQFYKTREIPYRLKVAITHHHTCHTYSCFLLIPPDFSDQGISLAAEATGSNWYESLELVEPVEAVEAVESIQIEEGTPDSSNKEMPTRQAIYHFSGNLSIQIIKVERIAWYLYELERKTTEVRHFRASDVAPFLENLSKWGISIL